MARVNLAGQDVYHEVRKAVSSGRLTRPTHCERCCKKPRGKRPIQAHHPRGYEPPHVLDVEWLCGKCHVEVHCTPRMLEETTPEQRRQWVVKGGEIMRQRRTTEEWAALGRKGGLIGGRAAWVGVSAAERSRRGKLASQALIAKTTHEDRSASTRRGWETRRRRKAEADACLRTTD